MATSDNGLNLSRRDLMKLSAAGVIGTSMSGWLGVLASHAAQNPQAPNTPTRRKNCIVLWMDGGPSHKDTFDLKPGTAQGGPYRAIQTNVAGIQISEHFPRLAQLMNHGTIIQHEHGGRRPRPRQEVRAAVDGRRPQPQGHV
jgi:hypothetical protein